MAFTTVTVQAATTNASGSTTASLGANGANRFAILVDASGGGSLNPMPNSMSFTASWDGSTYWPVDPIARRGNIFIFDAPASNVGFSWSGNPAGNSLVVLAYAYTD